MWLLSSKWKLFRVILIAGALVAGVCATKGRSGFLPWLDLVAFIVSIPLVYFLIGYWQTVTHRAAVIPTAVFGPFLPAHEYSLGYWMLYSFLFTAFGLTYTLTSLIEYGSPGIYSLSLAMGVGMFIGCLLKAAQQTRRAPHQ